MTCPHCESWAPVTRTQLATREKNLTRGGEIFACPKCGTRDWATNKSKIGDRSTARRDKFIAGLIYAAIIIAATTTFYLFSR